MTALRGSAQSQSCVLSQEEFWVSCHEHSLGPYQTLGMRWALEANKGPSLKRGPQLRPSLKLPLGKPNPFPPKVPDPSASVPEEGASCSCLPVCLRWPVASVDPSTSPCPEHSAQRCV